MGCCEGRESKGSYLVTNTSGRIVSHLKSRLNRENLIQINEFLEIEDSLKLMNLNRKIRDWLPENLKIVEVLKNLTEKYQTELDTQQLLTDIGKFIFEFKINDDIIIKSICLIIKKQILSQTSNAFKIKILSTQGLELLHLLCDYIDINFEMFQKRNKNSNKLLTISISSKETKTPNNDDLLRKYLQKISKLFFIVKNLDFSDFNVDILLESLDAEENYLSSLDISNNYFKKDTLFYLGNFLKNNHNLTHLYLRGNKLNDREIEALSESLKLNKSIILLDLSRNLFTQIGCQSLSEMLKLNKSIKELYLGGNSLKNEGIKLISDGIQVNRFLTILDCGNCNLSFESSIYLCVLMKVTKILEKLILVGNCFGDEGLKNIFEGLIFNTSLQMIFLDNNSIGDLFGYQIKELLQNQRLKVLSLSRNNLSDITAEFISQSISNNQNIETLILYENKITDFGGNLLLNSVKNNENFSNLIITHNKFSDEFISKLKRNSDKYNFSGLKFILKYFSFKADCYVGFDYFLEEYRIQGSFI